MIRIQKIWALIVGVASITVGTLKFFKIVHIPLPDAIIHISTGIVFIGAIWFKRGIYINKSNAYLGMFYILFGLIGNFNWPHMVLGILSALIGFVIKPDSASSN